MKTELRPGLTISHLPESQFGFEFFIHRSPRATEEMDLFLEKTKERDCQALLDVGAFHGIFSLAFCAASEIRIACAVEPSPLAIPFLTENIQRNLSPVGICTMAFSDHNGELEGSYEWDHAVIQGREDPPLPLKMMGITGDLYCEQHAFSPDVIKIDVEGHELKVIRGLTSIILRNRPLLFVELHPDHLTREGDTLGDFEGLMEKLGYKFTVPEHEDQVFNVFLEPT